MSDSVPLSLKHGPNETTLVCPVCQRDTGDRMALGKMNLYVCGECGQRMFTPDVPRKNHQCVRCGSRTYELVEEDAKADEFTAGEEPCVFCEAAQDLLPRVFQQEFGKVRVARLEEEDGSVVAYIASIPGQAKAVTFKSGEVVSLLHGCRVLVDMSGPSMSAVRVIETGVAGWMIITSNTGTDADLRLGFAEENDDGYEDQAHRSPQEVQDDQAASEDPDEEGQEEEGNGQAREVP